MTKLNVHASDIVGDILSNGGDLLDYGSRGIKQLTKKRIRKLSPNIIRIGDTVKITNPEIISRIGYPMSFEDARKEIKELYHNEIIEMFNKTIYKQILDESSKFNLNVRIKAWNGDVTYEKIVSSLAWIHIQSKGFGGKERRIYSEQRQELIGITAKVINIMIRKTGIYFSPSGGYDSWSGEYESEPGGLEKEKTHKILELDYWHPNEITQLGAKSNYILIEACNVEKIPEEEIAKTAAFKKGRQLGRSHFTI